MNADQFAEKLTELNACSDATAWAAGKTLRQAWHDHWACGWIAGYAIRVYDDHGNITPAFKAWHGIQERLESYPILDESDYSNREYESTARNVEDTGRAS